MEGTKFKCICGITLSRRKDKSTHEKTQKHILAIQQRKVTKSVAKEREVCIHHWKIDASSGPHSVGYCLRCGLQRKFANSVETGSNWGDPDKTNKRQKAAATSYKQRNG